MKTRKYLKPCKHCNNGLAKIGPRYSSGTVSFQCDFPCTKSHIYIYIGYTSDWSNITFKIIHLSRIVAYNENIQAH